MKNRVLIILLVAIFTILCIIPMATQAADIDNQYNNQTVFGEEKIYDTATLEDDFAEDCVLVVLTNEASLDRFDYGVDDFPEIDCTSVSNLTSAISERVQVVLAGESVAEIFGSEDECVVPQDFYNVNVSTFHQILLLKIANGSKEKVLTSIEALEQRTDILYVGPDYTIPLESNVLCAAMPDDPYADVQWAIEKIELLDAWDICTGSNSIVVGVVDTGIDQTHREMVGKIVQAKSVVCNNEGQYSYVSVVRDSIGHGTMVAGVIGASTNNQHGISGVNWNVQLASLCVTEDNLVTSSVRLATAINAAEDMNIPIINISMSVTSDWGSLLEVAVQNYTGLIVCAAGNAQSDLGSFDCYPAKFSTDNMIVVGASTVFDQPWEASNYGSPEVDLFAPGAAIISCFPRVLCDQTDDNPNDYDYPCDNNGMVHHASGYHAANGTSFAAPYVAGVAALIMAEYPNLSIAEVRAKILNGVDVVSGFVGKCDTNGRLNAYKALCSHTYNSSYEYSDSNYHISYCACGMFRYDAHTWLEGDGYLYCEDCGSREYI